MDIHTKAPQDPKRESGKRKAGSQQGTRIYITNSLAILMFALVLWILIAASTLILGLRLPLYLRTYEILRQFVK